MKQPKFLCKVVGHQYTLVNSIYDWLHRVKCKRCQRDFVLNEHLDKIVPLDPSLELVINSLQAIDQAADRGNLETKNQEITFNVKRSNEGTFTCNNPFFDDPGGTIPGYQGTGPGS